jgi:aspartate kinase
MVTLKFGGTSVADAAALSRLRAIVGAQAGERVVVVSALSGVTDQLLAISRTAEAGQLPEALDAIRRLRERHETIADIVGDAVLRARVLADVQEHWTDLEALVRAVAILRSAAPAFRDAIAACGELASSRIVAAALSDGGVPASWVDARLVLCTDGRHERAVALAEPTTANAERQIRPVLQRGDVAVLGGFVGATADGVTTTLGRGGSDFSASLVGACLAADEIQIWTDTDGVLTADPRVLDRAVTVDGLSFREASALAHFGAKVLHPATVAPAIDRGIPVRILNSRRPEARGTLVTGRAAKRRNPLAGLACLSDVLVIDVALPPDATRERQLADVFATCAAHGATVYASSIGDADVSVILGGGPAALAAAAALETAVGARSRDDLALLAVAGDGLSDGRSQVGALLTTLKRVTVAAIAESSRAGFVALAVRRTDLLEATTLLHRRFFETGNRTRRPASRRPRLVSVRRTAVRQDEEAVA